jgi:hypothetical protein
MKHIIILLIVASLLGCSTTAKQKVRDTMADVTHAVEVLNDKYCAETNVDMRNIIITGIHFYFPAYPNNGYCNLVEIVNG